MKTIPCFLRNRITLVYLTALGLAASPFPTHAAPPATAANKVASRSPVAFRDLFVKEQGGQILLGNAKVQLAFGRTDGAWRSFRLDAVSGSLTTPAQPAPAVDFRIDDVWMVEKHGARFLRYETALDTNAAIVTLRMVFGVGERPALLFIPERWRSRAPDIRTNPPPLRYEFELSTIYTLRTGETRLERSARLARQPSNNLLYGTFRRLEGFLFQVPGVALGRPEDNSLQLTGPLWRQAYLPPGTPYAAFKDKFYDLSTAPDRTAGMVVLRNNKLATSLASWLDTKAEVAYYTYLSGDGKRASILHYDLRTFRLEENTAANSDTHWIEIAPGPLENAFRRRRELSERQTPLNPLTPKWARELVILEVYPPYFAGGLKEIEARLPFYQGVGINAVYLMPHWKGGYSPIDPFEVEPAFGTKDDLRNLIGTAHRLGMKVLFDMVIHGFNKASPVIQQHPEFFQKNEQGLLITHHAWGSYTTDPANPAYQQYMVDLVRHDLREYDIDGYRIDANTYKAPNWDPAVPYPAWRGACTLELQQKMYAAMLQAKPDTVILSEIFGPVWHHLCNLVHDSANWASQVALEKMDVGEMTAASFKQLMMNTYDSLPAGANRVYFARNHDTSWFGAFGGYTPRFRALEAIQCLCAIPEIFAGDPKHLPSPDSDPTVWDYYRKILALRRPFPELANGELLLHEVRSDQPWVFTALRRGETNTCLVVVSLSDRPQSTRVTLQPDLMANLKSRRFRLVDPISNRTTDLPIGSSGEIAVELEPFQVMVGRLD